ncbi:MAG: AraC family transcriptional regulator [Candidatus Omnitrophica bacterium]|nr:AraC family transcriptional regulator [Candidatus Omnitrophota bacterium]MCM8807944.1 AraC family transcriptional regulator [Candidatus Omnitrophota bacterium]
MDEKRIIELDNFQKKYFIEREPFFQKLVPNGEIIDVKWITPKNPTFIGFHNEYEIHFFKKGGGIYFINGLKCEVNKNSVVIIKPKQIHYFIPEKNKDIEKGTLYFLPQIIKKLKIEKKEILNRDSPCNLILTEEEATIVELIFKFILRENEEKNDYWQDIVTSLLKILILFFERIKREHKEEFYINPLVKNMIEYIEKNFKNEFSLEKMARELKFSVSHLSHLFKKHMGLSIKQYLLQRRIAEAKYILENEPFIKIIAVAERVGFSNFPLFNRCFKKIVGMTPLKYKKYILQRGKGK